MAWYGAADSGDLDTPDNGYNRFSGSFGMCSLTIESSPTHMSRTPHDTNHRQPLAERQLSAACSTAGWNCRSDSGPAAAVGPGTVARSRHRPHYWRLVSFLQRPCRCLVSAGPGAVLA